MTLPSMSSHGSVDRVPARYLGGRGFDSCQGLRFILCPTLMSCWLFHLYQKKSLFWLKNSRLLKTCSVKYNVNVGDCPVNLLVSYFFPDHHTQHLQMSSLLVHAFHGRSGFRMVSIT